MSADDPAKGIETTVHEIVRGMSTLLAMRPETAAKCSILADDTFVGDGYGVPSDASREAQRLAAAQQEALFVDNTYTAKALAGLIAWIRVGRFQEDQTVLFWHTGGQVGLFA